MALIDEHLFRPGSWRALNAANQVVAGVRPGTLDAALALCGQGTVTTFFGRLRPGVLAVDIDLAKSSEAVAALVGWCVERELWHLVRESGRPGHQHVFVVAGEHSLELQDFASKLRTALRVGRPAIDVRDTVRPLCTPHRSGAHPPQPKRILSAKRSLTEALAALGHSPGVGRRTSSETSPPWGRPVVAAVPVPTRARSLPDAWSAYLAEGKTPPQVGTWSDRSRSALEACATFQMVACGWSVQRAWLAVESAHPDAMGKARERGRDWWLRHVWNRAVADHVATGTTASPVRQGARETGQAATDHAALVGRVRELQATFLTVWTKYGRDRRHTLRFVLDTVAERMIRTGSAVVPCPERDFVVDTGITSRQVLRAALHQLHDDGWLVLATTFDSASSDSAHRSHHIGLPDRPPHEPPSSPTVRGLALSYPPSSFTPLRSHLRPPLWHTLTSLPPPETPAGLDKLTELPGIGGATPRTLLNRLVNLATMGLAACDASGSWWALPPPKRVLEGARVDLAQRSADVGEERARYELVRAGRGRWEKQREAALDRGRRARWEGARAWWNGLPDESRAARQETYRSRYAALPVVEQARVKDVLARRRADAGIVSEEAARQGWIHGQDPDTYAQRITERTAAFHSLPPPMRAVRVAAWEDHRRRWGTQRQTYPPLPRATDEVPTAELLEQQETLALGEALDRDPDWRRAGIAVAAAAPSASGMAAS